MTSIVEGRDLRPATERVSPSLSPQCRKNPFGQKQIQWVREDLIIDKPRSSAFAHPHPAHSLRAGVSAAGSERLSLPGVSLTHSAFFSLSPLLFVDLTTSVFVSN